MLPVREIGGSGGESFVAAILRDGAEVLTTYIKRNGELKGSSANWERTRAGLPDGIALATVIGG